ncbi:MAG: DUF2254 domain-containing protein [Candidatus Margulisbacteria bacterium]|nr:DUF2254 domain-containing protein [Candidatus Margulisiibacteriota bacterium]
MLKNLYVFIQKRKLFLYFYILAFVIILTYVLSHSCFGVYIGFPMTDPDSAKSLISTIIQSEAAILAIVVTLSLVAVQQTASSYSIKVIEIFKNVNSNPDFYLLIGIYLTSIIYEMWVLKQINTDSLGKIASLKHSLFSSFEAHIWTCYALGTFSLLSLILYIQNTLDLLKPSTIMSLLSEKITKNNILLADPFNFSSNLVLYDTDLINNGVNIENREDPILPIVDVINSSLMKYDYEVARNGLLIIIKSSINILEDDSIENQEFKKIYTFFAKLFFNIGKLAIYKSDEKCAELVMNWFYRVTLIIIRKPDDHSVFSPDYVYAISKLGEIAAEQNNTRLIISAIRHLERNIEKSFESDMEYLQTRITTSIGNIGESCAEYKVRDLLPDVLDPLFRIIRIAFKEESEKESIKYKDDHDYCEEFKEEYGIEYIEEFSELPDDLILLAVKAIIKMGYIAHENNMTEDVVDILRYTRVIGKNAEKYGRDDVSRLLNDFSYYVLVRSKKGINCYPTL